MTSGPSLSRSLPKERKPCCPATMLWPGWSGTNPRESSGNCLLFSAAIAQGLCSLNGHAHLGTGIKEARHEEMDPREKEGINTQDKNM